eukprot:Gregarina_sp_Poly_1__4250@NODE_2317_length_2303_cov_364_055456_g1484_i0_p1_GENE_NODE_2317_length_2303_cov_364_055456_g1484_i0NODE_2317_length_2303_cov_364_055456_g1484_i0_p1_ORF_typecomplete_len259_score30_71Glutaredoxin2_C/PF04399_13/1_8e27GST_N_3/PF13417_6/0_0001GST_C/PF00043_25/0_00021GST_N_4/PF17172_4/0_0027GST_N_2/PF13409_6/0_044GST_N_2/PF13409_6/3_8e03GST_C_2/PF13410_6/0_073Glutaredoxin/PF00462_24/0_13_NODE_2317_length_2303_cov_364_055456_g1484_i02411017
MSNTGHVHPPQVPDNRVYLRPIPNLYIYDHCPFCVKARMIFGIHNIKVNLIFFANDDFEGPISLIGKKAVPILEYSHKGSQVVMPESGDIIQRVDSHEDFGNQGAKLQPGTKVEAIRKAWRSASYHDLLTIITPERRNLGEFQHVQCRQTFIVRHALASGLKFNEAWKHYDQYVKDTNEVLKQLDSLVESEDFVTGNTWSEDDIELFSWTRGLTGVKGIEWPSKLEKYLQSVSKRTDIPLYFNCPVGPDTRDPELFAY